jgi:hypothetical protein
MPQLPRVVVPRPPWIWPGIYSYWEHAKATRAYTYANFAVKMQGLGTAFKADTDRNSAKSFA